MKYGYTGFSSTIAQKIHEIVCSADPEAVDTVKRSPLKLPPDLDYYFLCAGVLAGKAANDISRDEIIQTMDVNMLDVMVFCDNVFRQNARAKVCVIGSMSGFNGSYDMTYAASKAGLHLYVEQKELTYPQQQLVCIAPTIIEDSGMTQRRPDLADVKHRGRQRRLNRWLRAEEVAKVACFAIAQPSMCNTVIKLTGGNY